MISAVSSFFPSSISRSSPFVTRSADARSPQIILPSSSGSLASGSNSGFADRLQQFFSLTPADFSSAFGGAGADNFPAKLPGAVSAAYTQSNLLTRRQLSLNV